MLLIGTAGAPAASNELLSPRALVCGPGCGLLLDGFNSVSTPSIVGFFSEFALIYKCFVYLHLKLQM